MNASSAATSPPQPPPPPSSSSSSSSSLLLCMADGKLYSMDAWTGVFRPQVVSTEPLITSQRFASEENDSDSAVVSLMPDLDGRLYWQHGEGPNSNLQELDVTMQSLVHNPVKTCSSDDVINDEEEEEGEEEKDDENDNAKTVKRNGNSNCAILTATVETSLFALDENGDLLWSKEGHRTRTASSSSSSSSSSSPKMRSVSPLLLQRQDFRVRHISSQTGLEMWNVSLGTWQALDFDEENDVEEVEDFELLLPGRVQDKRETLTVDAPDKNKVLLPAIIFSNAGRTLEAIDPRSEETLWTMTTQSVVASVFGMHQGRWRQITVLTEKEKQHGGKSVLDQTRLRQLPSLEDEVKNDNLKDFMINDILHRTWLRQWTEPRSQEGFQRALPAPTSSGVGGAAMAPTPFTVCLVADGKGDCPNLKPTTLQLPSPTDASFNHKTLQADGLLLSWTTVCGLLFVLLLAIITGILWYRHKKRQWLSTATKSIILETSAAASRMANSLGIPGAPILPPSLRFSMSQSAAMPITANSTTTSTTPRSLGKKLLSEGRALTRSISLPFVFDGKDSKASMLLKRSRGNSIFEPFSEADGDSTLPTPRPPPVDSRSVVQAPTAAVAPLALAGIPLVRYSRYASEFKEVEALGRGGFGTVFKCRNALDGREYAIKKVTIRGSTTMSPDNDPSFLERLERVLREVKILAVLDHPNIVRYYTAWLELEETSDSAGRNGDDETTTLSRCHSSSCIVTESASHWPASPHRLGPGLSQPLDRSRSKNPLGWKTGLYDNSACLIQRTVARGSDCGFLFEHSNEDACSSKEQSEESPSIRSAGSYRRPYDNSHPFVDDPLLSEYGVTFEESQDATDAAALTAGGALTSSNQREKDTASEIKSQHGTPSEQPKPASASKTARHTLYIQMQLCSQKTIGDYLSNSLTRQEADVDIAAALRLFLQIAQAVKHVHEQGLIHRDLKPQNCFIDEFGTVKVGDFGLSRESGENREEETLQTACTIEAGHTAGVGTRSYASPEQMTGSDYDSSADVFSLGVILFELLYPMYTGMERNVVLSQLRQLTFPSDWDKRIGNDFPTLQNLIKSMLSAKPADRPTAASVVDHIQSILSEFTLVSLDEGKHQGPDIILLRVEAQHHADALGETLKAIHESTSGSVVQYGMRSSSQGERLTSVMEFAIRSDGQGSDLVHELQKRPGILKVRQVSTSTGTTTSLGRSNN